MKFVVNWKINHLATQQAREEVMAMFGQMTPEDDAAQLGTEITQIARWHDAAANGQGGGLFETESGAALAAFFNMWSPVFESTITPVIDDAELRSIIQAANG